ncbi:isoprenyl transferase [Dyadobacter sandarakinus]|uniref:Isoprenyl transferase n=1 Tax=Dyadobacter sandarakinus TaxID=2747268 RepID=A0ABX7IAW3_9BACT|nr:isoprenyl transferase [Dyadobacter sandarakinus]QRR02268.1 isoprenyl transferase [Dyadobacter sandarakinus]
MKELIDTGNLPKHIAVIMDGNGRWAQNQGAARVFGHRNAIKAVREVTEGCAELGVSFLTLYAFSTENWGRPEYEVRALMELLVQSIRNELPTMQKNNVKLDTIGDTDSLPKSCRNQLAEAIDETRSNTGLNLILALGYSGKWDLAQATRKLADEVKAGTLLPGEINEEMIAAQLSTGQRPDVDLMLRTGGDHRISNFLLWQLAYAELYFYENLFWPDFRREHLYEAIVSFQNRERRFGKTGDQVKANSAKSKTT